MKLLLVNALYPPRAVGGAERSVALLAEALARDGVEVHVATLTEECAESVALERGVTVHRLPIDLPYWPWSGTVFGAASRLRWHLGNRWNKAAARRLGSLLDRVRPDLVHSHVLTGFSSAVWPEVKQRGIALAQTLRDYSLICPRAALFRRGRPCVARCPECRLLTSPTRSASLLVDAIAGNSNFTLEAHRRAGRFAGIEGRRLFNIVMNSVDQWPTPQEGPLRFGFLGRIEREKGIETLLAALPRIEREGWSLRVGGSGRAGYVEECKTKGGASVAWLGQVEAARFYRSIDVLVVPSLWPEPLPRTLVEAAAHGCAIIAASSGGIPEVATVAHRSALYRANNSGALAAAMRDAIDSPEAWRTRAAPGALLEPFTEAAVVAAHQAFYDAARRAAW